MFDEQPDGDPHGECAAEIARLNQALGNLLARIHRDGGRPLDLRVVPLGWARKQDLLTYAPCWMAYTVKPAPENGHEPVALYSQDQLDAATERLRDALAWYADEALASPSTPAAPTVAPDSLQVTAQPVGEVVGTHKVGFAELATVAWEAGMPPLGTKLYTTPPPPADARGSEALRSALERVTHNFRLMLAGKPVRDARETLGEVDAAIAASQAAPQEPKP